GVGFTFALFTVSLGLLAQSCKDPVVPNEPGLYLHQKGQMSRVEGQVVSFARTGGTLASKATLGIKSAKVNVQILGKSARVTAESSPTFYFRAASDNEAAGGGVADLVLLRMK